MHNINKSQVTLLITELIITTLFDRVLIMKYPMLPRALCLPKKVVHNNPSVT
jgi:hypothetical protein